MGKKSFNIILIASILSLVFIIIFILPSPSSTENFLEENLIEDDKVVVKPLLDIEKNNGMVTNIWLEDKKQLGKFIENGIKYLFVDVGDIDKNGKLITEEKELRHFLDLVNEFEKENNYDFVLLPYNEIIIEDSNEYALDSDTFTNNVTNNHKWLIELGFDGVHIDIEAIPFDQREDYLEFLEKLSEEIGEKNMITVYSGSLNDKPNIWEWGSIFYRGVADRVDIILIPGYDFDLNSKEEYQAYVAEQIENIASQEWGAKFMFTVPTHKESPETLENSLEIYQKEIVNHENHPFVGITIFAEWTTNKGEWKVFENFIS